jgi:predicted O-methyltransferase YrrM
MSTKALYAGFEKYIEEHTSPQEDYLYELYRETYLKTMYPRMLSGHLQGKFLKMISMMIRPERILEIGTFTGYSTINLALGLAGNGILHTIDSNAESVEIGRKYFAVAGIADKIRIHIGNALLLLPEIDEMFDLIFIDADKENYPTYYRMVFDKLKSGGFLLADNAFWDGKVLKRFSDKDADTKGIAEFNDLVQTDMRVENTIIPIRDGMVMVRKI